MFSNVKLQNSINAKDQQSEYQTESMLAKRPKQSRNFKINLLGISKTTTRENMQQRNRRIHQKQVAVPSERSSSSKNRVPISSTNVYFNKQLNKIQIFNLQSQKKENLAPLNRVFPGVLLSVENVDHTETLLVKNE